jgi:hypothetical protein
MNRRHASKEPELSRAVTYEEISSSLQEMLRGGLAILWRGFEYARELDADVWEFGLNCDTLRRAGLSDIDLRWLIARGYVECSLDPAPNGGQRHWSPKDQSWNESNAQFILTKAGAILALQVLSRPLNPLVHMPSEGGRLADQLRSPDQATPRPSWDSDRKELRFQERVIKQFRWAAVNQETILMAFEEESWPTRIDDPLPQKQNQDPKSRLHDTIKCLNRNHKARLIRFTGDGTGEGIRWMLLERDAGEA